MPALSRIPENPFLVPDPDDAWQAYASFNPCVVTQDGEYQLVYRAMSAPRRHEGNMMSVSSIGVASGATPFRFPHTRQFIVPDTAWDRYGCEDPRVVRVEDKYLVFYTALSTYPFDAAGIRVGVAVSRDLRTVDEKHLVTPFNAKAMALFPEKIDGRYVAVLTVDTDRPPAKIALARFDELAQIWSESYWSRWYASLPENVIPLLRSRHDHLEVGAPPVKTAKGWLLVHSYIRNYFSSGKQFGIEAVLLDLEDPSIVVGRTATPLLVPEKHYELDGDVPNVIFPSGALIEGDELRVYYGAADTTCCVATISVRELLAAMCRREEVRFIESRRVPNSFRRYAGNPIITPRPELAWEAKSTFNPAVIHESGNFHLLYRAMSLDGKSVLGYARSEDGVHCSLRPHFPAYVPRETFELGVAPGYFGCEDPRLTRLGNRVYLFYTAFDGKIPRVAFSSIPVQDFLDRRWNWKKPQVISPPGIADKDACLFPEQVGGKYLIFHRVNGNMFIASTDSLENADANCLADPGCLVRPGKEYPGHQKFGVAAPPLRTGQGWLVFFHHVSDPDSTYRVEAMLLDIQDPARVLAETAGTLLEPEMDYERAGDVPNVVFPCGAVLRDRWVHLYYGGGDRVIGVARMSLEAIFKQMGR